MSASRDKISILLGIFLVVLFPGISLALNILLTNDDGYNSPGIEAMRTALLQAGHSVTVVAPKDNQSKASGTVTAGLLKLVRVVEEEDDVWSIAGTPSDCILAAVGGIMIENPPDLVVSGANLGANLGCSSVRISGTVNAALTAASHGIPAIAVSVGLNYPDEYPDYPSTFTALSPAAFFIADLINALFQSAANNNDNMLPSGMVLNVNIPVPFESIQGAMYTQLAQTGIVECVWKDYLGAVSNAGGYLVVYARSVLEPDAVPNSDRDAYLNGFISLTVLDGRY